MNKMRKILAGVLALMMLLSTLTVGVSAAQYSDVSGHWSEMYDSYWSEKGIFEGFPDGTFRPDGKLTRAQMITILTRFFGVPLDVDYDISAVADVKPTDWYYKYVRAGYRWGMVNGTSATTYSPESTVTREQFFEMLVRGIGYKKDALITKSFTDYGKTSTVHVGALNTLVNKGIVEGDAYGNTVRPLSPITRGEVAKVLYKLFGNYIDTAYCTTDGATLTFPADYPGPVVVLANNVTVNADHEMEVIIGGNAENTKVNVTAEDVNITVLRDDCTLNVEGSPVMPNIAANGEHVTIIGANSFKITVTESSSNVARVTVLNGITDGKTTTGEGGKRINIAVDAKSGYSIATVTATYKGGEVEVLGSGDDYYFIMPFANVEIDVTGYEVELATSAQFIETETEVAPEVLAAATVEEKIGLNNISVSAAKVGVEGDEAKILASNIAPEQGLAATVEKIEESGNTATVKAGVSGTTVASASVSVKEEGLFFEDVGSVTGSADPLPVEKVEVVTTTWLDTKVVGLTKETVSVEGGGTQEIKTITLDIEPKESISAVVSTFVGSVPVTAEIELVHEQKADMKNVEVEVTVTVPKEYVMQLEEGVYTANIVHQSTGKTHYGTAVPNAENPDMFDVTFVNSDGFSLWDLVQSLIPAAYIKSGLRTTLYYDLQDAINNVKNGQDIIVTKPVSATTFTAPTQLTDGNTFYLRASSLLLTGADQTKLDNIVFTDSQNNAKTFTYSVDTGKSLKTVKATPIANPENYTVVLHTPYEEYATAQDDYSRKIGVVNVDVTGFQGTTVTLTFNGYPVKFEVTKDDTAKTIDLVGSTSKAAIKGWDEFHALVDVSAERAVTDLASLAFDYGTFDYNTLTLTSGVGNVSYFCDDVLTNKAALTVTMTSPTLEESLIKNENADHTNPIARVAAKLLTGNSNLTAEDLVLSIVECAKTSTPIEIDIVG